MTQISVPLPLVVIAGFVLAVIVIAQLPVSRYTGKPAPLDELQAKLGLSRLNAGVFFLIGLMWIVIFALLFGGLVKLIWAIIVDPLPTSETIWDWRFALAKLTALTGVLGAVVLLPVTLLKLALTREQTQTATEALFNDKINAATTDLYSLRQITRWSEDVASNGWEDDVIRRNAAIDRLEGLVEERPEISKRVAGLLVSYLQEVSQISEAEQATSHEANEFSDVAIRASASNIRSDMLRVVRTLGRLPNIPGINQSSLPRQLVDLDLGGIQLKSLCFDHITFSNCDFSRADFSKSSFVGSEFLECNLRHAQLTDANFVGAQFHRTNLRNSNLLDANLDGALFQHCELSYEDLLALANMQVLLHSSLLNGRQIRSLLYSVATEQGRDFDTVQAELAEELGLKDVASGAPMIDVWREWHKHIGFMASSSN